ncbi:hypothetical protein PG994_001745 [Apiospora phragmitis]|uniref:Uncharacterized protein n=1 Tax=Apiospora phragmitis TaxID=2905665 RepID=A0ABR1WUF8_9PEZI
MEASPVGFLDLPREIRNEIYSLLLCGPRHLQATFTYPYAYATSPGGGKSLHLAILRANRQIGDEAREVFYKTNRFVRVSIRLEGPSLRALMAGFASNYLPLPMIVQRRSAIGAFKGFIMSYKLSQTNPPQKVIHRHELIILHRDLHVLCLCLETATILSDNFGDYTMHSITLHNPVKSMDNSYPTIDQQEALLSPFAKLRGFQHVYIKGHVKFCLATQIMTQVQVKPETNKEVILEDLLHYEQLGHEYLRQKLLDKSCEAWAGACKKIDILGHPDATYGRCLAQATRPWFNRVGELFFELNRKLWANVICIMESNLDDPKLVRNLADSALEGLGHALRRGAFWRGAFLTADWRPSTEQKADMLRQKARVCRLSQRFRKALRKIKQAEELWPGDPDIREERFAVEWTLCWANFTVGEPESASEQV